MNDLWKTINDIVYNDMNRLNGVLFEPSPMAQYTTEYEPEKANHSIICGDIKSPQRIRKH